MHLAEDKQIFLALANPVVADRKWNHVMKGDQRYDERSQNLVMVLRIWLATQEQTTLMISFRPETNTISVFGIFSDNQWMMELLGQIRNKKGYAGHPMLIPILLCAGFLQCHSMDLNMLGEEVKRLETEAGVRDFSLPSNATFLANASIAIRKSTDLKARLIDCETHVRIMKEALLEQTTNSLRIIRQTLASDRWPCTVVGATAILEDTTDSLKLQTVKMLIQLGSLTTKTDTTLSAVSYEKQLRKNSYV